MIIKSYILENNEDLFKCNLSLFYGQNLGLINSFKEKIKDFYKKKAEIYTLYQKELIEEKSDFFVKISTLSLFNKQKVFLIHNCTDKIIPILEKLENEIDGNRIFLFSDILDKKSKLRSHFEKSKKYSVIPCYEDNEASLKKIIEYKLENFTGVNTNVINKLISNCDLSRIKLNNELEKMTIFFSNRKINDNELDLLLNTKESENFNNVSDSALLGDQVKTNQLLNNVTLETEKTFFYLSVINQRFTNIKNILILSRNSNLETALNQIKPPIFWKDKPIVLNQLKKWSLKKINLALNKTYNVETQIKSSSTLNKNLLLKQTIIDVCNLANAA